MHDHGLRQQVDAALRRAINLTGPEQYHRDCALVLELVREAFSLGIEAALTQLAQDVLVVGFSGERAADQGTGDRQLMMALEAINDILEAHRLDDMLSGVLGMARWVYVCLSDGDRRRLRELALLIEHRAGMPSPFTEAMVH